MDIQTDLISPLMHYHYSLDRYSDEQFAAKPSEEAWSLGQMYEHLYVATTFFFMANVKRCLEKRKGQEGGEMNDSGRKVLQYNSFPPIKLKVPEALQGPEPVARSRAEYRPLWEVMVRQVEVLAQEVGTDPGLYKTPNPTFGWLNAEEWLRVCGMHTRHHLRQQQEREAWLGL
ncbi:DinB family protein [Rhabdobacter roseus]|uniref:DinB-like domain-containing protein n=1 Tax=Rhabdobacter roseus TaxID=1655419 RepID=A0A840TV96_9BACT|nr:DinB family protein [Rhabdobacter roseus]MBB5286825.1 hypothetical protein [Rhabdobacter roseus]